MTDARYLFVKHTWALNISLLVLLAILSARILNNRLAQSMLPVSEDIKVLAPRIKDSKPRYIPPISVIVARDLFNAAVTPDRSRSEPAEQGIKATSLRIKLIGIVFHHAGHKWNIATIINRVNRKTGIFKKGDKVAGQATIVSIESDRVILERAGGLLEELLLSVKKQENPGASPKKQIERVGDHKFIISKKLFQSHLNNPTKIISQGRMLPVFVGRGDQRRIDGFRISRIQSSSVFEQLGFKNSDVLKAINGHRLDGRETAFRLFQSLQQETVFTLEIVREKNSLEFHYTVE